MCEKIVEILVFTVHKSANFFAAVVCNVRTLDALKAPSAGRGSPNWSSLQDAWKAPLFDAHSQGLAEARVVLKKARVSTNRRQGWEKLCCSGGWSEREGVCVRAVGLAALPCLAVLCRRAACLRGGWRAR